MKKLAILLLTSFAIARAPLARAGQVKGYCPPGWVMVPTSQFVCYYDGNTDAFYCYQPSSCAPGIILGM